MTGLVALGDDCVLCVCELLDFQQGVIGVYRYEVSRCHPAFSLSPLPEPAEYCSVGYPDKEKLSWYDSWPHPNDASLALTYPHQKHVAPSIKRHRLPAPKLSFSRPNLPFLIEEIEHDLLRQP